MEKTPEQIQISRNRDLKIEKSTLTVLPCKTLLELTVGWAAGVLARDTTFAMTGVESFLKEGGPDEEAGAVEGFAGWNEQKKTEISNMMIDTMAFLKQYPPSGFISR